MHRTAPTHARGVQSAALAAGLACALAIASVGCGGDHHLAPVLATGPRLPVGTPANDAPDSTVRRLLVAYSYMAASEYDTLLTSDFHYHFSDQTDPALVSLYGLGWNKTNERQSVTHLFNGFTNGLGTYMPAASSIATSIINGVVGDDTSHADSSAWYQALTVNTLNMNIDVPTSSGSATYNISTPIVFLLVRGDAAVLGAGQSNSATRWYVREMDDLMPAVASKFPHTMPAQATSWGALRAAYLH